ncbi:probable transposase, fragment [Desulfotalea psychrophila LSv54]|uniref:Probable transposase n=1 Tax=Desulfotalea psychrophila (strain LSv54 / DSM 12343) TaxID=177439 RepID=Q6ALA5_DESPS|nr:probable transposase, fragment [Desulfotalea psychrophila LSv54]
MRRNPTKEMLVHSDRGVQYASKEYRQLLQEKDFRQSMSRKGNCWDNAVAESFFYTLKTQYIHHRSFRDIEAAKYGLFQYIEAYYNRRRRHSANGYKSSAEFEEQFDLLQKLA